MKILKVVYFLFFFSILAVQVKSQEADIRVKDTKTENEILVGAVTREGLINIGNWFQEGYASYNPDTTAIKYLISNREELPNIFLVLGTWCGDSKEHVPHFYKVMDLVAYPPQKIFVVAVDRDKKAGDFCIGDFNVTLVPTFILSKGESELGRIIETPLISIEQDIVNIITTAR